MSYGSLYCKICGTSLRVLLPSGRVGSQITCINRCCPACHGLYCTMPGHELNAEKARKMHAERVLEHVRCLNRSAED